MSAINDFITCKSELIEALCFLDVLQNQLPSETEILEILIEYNEFTLPEIAEILFDRINKGEK